MPSYIDKPKLTPEIGESFEGGFFTGMIWVQLVQSSTLTTIDTGIKVFTVPDMTSSPIVYEGQLLSIRRRSAPDIKMVGTVANASGSTLTISVTAITGLGEFNDWSIMARYSIIVSPKKYGESKTIDLKSDTIPFPIGCQTLNDGWFSTNAMKNAGDATKYRAAWWARGLNINGYDDWYIPARDELELCWRNLKPTTDTTHTGDTRPTMQLVNYSINGANGDSSNQHGENKNSYPCGNAYTIFSPCQTAVSAFRTHGPESFFYLRHWYWSSTAYSDSLAWVQLWDVGQPGCQHTVRTTRVRFARAIRRTLV